MTPLSKIHEGTRVWVKSNRCQSAATEMKIVRVWEDADSFEFKYGDWSPSIADKDGFSKSTYRGLLSGYDVAETVARWNEPVSFWRETKIVGINLLHGIMGRWGFKMN